VKSDYYAPGVGPVLTTLTSQAGEKRITELASYSIPQSADAIKIDPAP